jgi:glycosyl transferase family 25
MEQQFARLGLSEKVQFFPAVNGYALDKHAMPHYDGRKRLFFFGRHLNQGEIGCLLSHRAIYEKMVRESIPHAIVLEDDAILAPDFTSVMQGLMRHAAHWDMVRFLSRPKVYRRTRVIAPLCGEYRLGRAFGTPGGSYGYIISLNAARTLLRLTEMNCLPVDILFGHQWRTGLNVLNLLPSPVSYDDQNESTIEAGRFDKRHDLKGTKKLAFWIGRGSWRIYEFFGKYAIWLGLWPYDLWLGRRLRRGG